MRDPLLYDLATSLGYDVPSDDDRYIHEDDAATTSVITPGTVSQAISVAMRPSVGPAITPTPIEALSPGDIIDVYTLENNQRMVQSVVVQQADPVMQLVHISGTFGLRALNGNDYNFVKVNISDNSL